MLCHTFRTIAHQTWDKLALAKSADYQILEESFTNFNLLDIKLRHPKQFFIKTFNKREESKTGADWEFWIRGKNRDWIGFRIQAKVINLTYSRYDHLHYKNYKNDIYQCNTLIDSSIYSKYKLFPLYCLYSYWEYSDYPNLYNLTGSRDSREHFGCSFVDAFTVFNLQESRNNHIRDIFHAMRPWSDLVCLSLTKENDMVNHCRKKYLNWNRQTLLRWFRNNLLDKSIRNDSINIESFFTYYDNLSSIEPYSRPPEYIQEILHSGNTDPQINIEDKNLQYISIFLETLE